MTITHTPEDFARAEFARRPYGGVAARVDPEGTCPWAVLHGPTAVSKWRSDWSMAAEGWAPVLTLRPQEEKEMLRLRGIGDADWHLRQAVKLASVDATDADVDALCRRIATGKPVQEFRALTPDDITDAMIQRTAHCLAMNERPSTYSHDPDGTAEQFDYLAREALAAALTEPPARPEGAEVIEAMVADQVGGDVPPATIRAIADHLAEHGVRPAWGGGSR